MGLSYSPKYHQDVIWVCEFLDGSILREWDDNGKEHPFNSIDKSRLKKFHLISKDFDYYFDASNGIFTIDGIRYAFPLAGENLNFAEGLIHFKSATTEFVSVNRKTSDYDGFEITGYEMGWKVSHDNIKSQVIFSLPQKVFTVEVTFLDLQKSISWSLKI